MMKGWMKYRQKGGLVGRITGLREHRYWFVLTDDCHLNGFKDEAASELGKPEITFNTQNSAITISQDTQNQFEIISDRQSLAFVVDTSDDTLSWVSAIQQLRSIKQGVSPAPSKILKTKVISPPTTTLKPRSASIGSGNTSNNNVSTSESESLNGQLNFDDPLAISTTPLSSGLPEFEWDNEINSATGSSASPFSTTHDESSALFQLSHELADAKAELARCQQRITSYQEVLASRDRQLFEMQDELLGNDKSIVTSEAYQNMEEQVKSYRDQNALLNEEVLKLHQMCNRTRLQAKEQQKKSEKLASDLRKFQRDYVSLLSHCVYRPLVEPDEGARFTVPEREHHITTLKNLVRQMKTTNDRVLGCSIPTLGKVEHVDVFGFVHALPNEALQVEYIAHHLQDAFDVLADSNVDNQNNLKKWKAFISDNSEQFEISPQFRKLVLRGIPAQYRAYMWQKLITYYIGDKKHAAGEGYFDQLFDQQDAKKDNKTFTKMIKQIVMDVPRTMPNNRDFSATDSIHRDRLQRVLTAFCIHADSDIGYCQGFNFLAGGGLLFLEEEDVFWFLVAVTEKIFPPDYYCNGLAGLLADQYVLQQILSQTAPKLMEHLMRFSDVDLAAVTTGWFLGLFFDCLPFQVLLRTWDCFLAFGHEAVFRISCIILKLFEPRLLELHDSSHLLHAVKNIPRLCSDPLYLINEAFNAPFPPWEEIEELRAQYEEEFSRKHQEKLRQRQYYDKSVELCEDVLSANYAGDKLNFECGAVGEKILLSASCRLTQNSQIYEVVSDQIKALSLPITSRVMCVHAVANDVVLVGLISGQLQAYSVHSSSICWSMSLSDVVLSITTHGDMVYVGTADGKLHILQEGEISSNKVGMRKPKLKDSIELSKRPTTAVCLIESENCLWVASGPAIYIVNLETYETDGFFLISSRLEQVSMMLPNSNHVWIATKDSSVIQLHDCTMYSKPPLLVYDIERDLPLPPLYPMMPDEPNPDASPSKRVSAMVLTNHHTLWIGNYEGELKFYDLKPEVVKVKGADEEPYEEEKETSLEHEESGKLTLSLIDCRKISERPVRCLLKYNSQVVSCSGYYGDEGSVRVWTLDRDFINVDVVASGTSSGELLEDSASLDSSSKSVDSAHADSRRSEGMATDTWRVMKKTANSTIKLYRDRKPNLRKFMNMLGNNQN
ncbi:uncharacterized protein LOC143447247 isoform X2 [Clavelina lepadiformis]|uniref:uncharacterized protein LOC143447247 isoform X2 n=1 Tax=Clavelina lepadiformis TaxID=159417 RepID=UPI0040428B04